MPLDFFSFIFLFKGEFAALSAALIWASASVIYSKVGRQLSPLILNLTKGWIAIVLIVLTLLLRGQLIPSISASHWGLLLLSGILGIGFGDTAYFNALNCIGARRTLLLETLAPSLSALLAMLFLQEHLSSVAWWGIGLTLTGVFWVVAERVPESAQTHFRPLRGLGFGFLAALGQSIGAVLSRAALSGTDIDPLLSTLIRLIGGTIVLLMWVFIRPPREKLFKPLSSQRLFVTVAGTAFISTYLGIWLQQISLKYAATGVAQALTNTSPLFILPIALWMGEKVSLRAVLGVAVALAGVWLLFNKA
ncbi:EamA family transporter [Phormidesmis priestleyi ULC007]|uniref:EamA family transporter n=1 Tax=Phormidesmis priestleyi ULC007 TaxID=1920490 RepID=A0A2T1DET0_9CYAN|nr:DMT family transporter [Phormidesmis priestleyi]PSB18999.1 EamA family transporter [Phormidesmis priestleyi ULC007]PZO53987.1 MAG: EamA family transporter [Phormidesmis priestleyi]